MKEIIIYHNTDNNETLLFIDGKLISDGCDSVMFEHGGNKSAKMKLSFEPKFFSPNSEVLKELKEKGFPFDMRKPKSNQ